jgi:collagenase-like PrtC family protease
MTARLPLSLTLGPVLYLWEPGEWRDFYFRIADEAPVDSVSLGEVVCSKRLHFTQPLLDAVIQRLQSAGKQVNLASLALVTTEREAIHHRKLAAGAESLIEANDLSMLPLLAGRPHVIGPYVNVYNAAMARLLAAKGAVRICLPPELPLAAIAAIAGAAPQVDIEVLAFGRLPLAISARCAHARAKGHSKDNCQFVCGEDPDGLLVETLDDQPFLTLNGVQTLSYTCHVALPQLGALAEAGVRHIRLSPQYCDMVAVSRLYADVRDGRTDVEAACAELARLYPDVPFSNGFLHAAAGNQWVAQEAYAP